MSRVKQGAESTAIWVGVFLLAEVVIGFVLSLLFAFAGGELDPGPASAGPSIVLMAAFAASFNQYKRRQRRKRAAVEVAP